MMVAFLVSGNPRLFQGNQGRWNIMIIYDIYTLAGYVLFCIDPIISHMLHFFLQMLLPFSFHLWFSCPKGSMGLVYLPTFTIKNHPNVFRYTIRGWYGCRVKKNPLIRWWPWSTAIGRSAATLCVSMTQSLVGRCGMRLRPVGPGRSGLGSWSTWNVLKNFPIPMGSMYSIFAYIYHNNQLNVGEYTIHGWYGI